MKSKILSVSIAAYNSQDYLRRCLDSFLIPEIMDDIEVIIVNDGSKDDTLEIATEYENRYPNTFVVIDKENGGHGSTINASRRVAGGKYYKAVDSDDWVDKEGFKKLVNHLKETDADLVYNPIRYVYQNDSTVNIIGCTRHRKRLPTNRILAFDRNSRWLRLSIHGMTIKTDLIRESEYLIDEKCYYVDQEYIIYYLLGVKTMMIYDFPVYVYLQGRPGQSVEFDSYYRNREQHIRVIFSLVDFWNRNKGILCKNARNAILDQLAYLIGFQYKIYLNTDDFSKTKGELTEFDRQIKEKSIDVYRATVVRSNIARAICLSSRAEYKGLDFIKKHYKLKK